ncbi:acyltransferase family protein [Methylobacterium oxalidis]|uniref:acyltransferase family protein n=1 Tax=Methylobacterium oxalidis TaxID=944322 RepID=UPI0033161E19
MRLNSLDSARGIAAFLVVVYHFQHLAAFGQDPASWTVEAVTLPLYPILKPIYLHGWMAVDLFFVISGFVFFWLYRDIIYERRIDAWSFFVLRFTRLYPLHILTLVLVAGLQIGYATAQGKFFVIPYNDSYHFWLNVFFLQSLVLDYGPSFNGPSWSISVEIALYCVFFLLSLARLSRSTAAILCIVCLGLLFQGVNPVIGRGIAGFFAGGLAYFAFSAVSRRGNRCKIVRRTIGITAVLWLVVLIAAYTSALDWGLATLGQVSYVRFADKLGGRFVMYGLFPLTVFALAASESILNWNWKALSVLGDLSYASYLMHFPLQLLFACLVAAGMISETSIVSLSGLTVFFVVLIPLSWVTYVYFELPMQRLGRRLLMNPRKRLARAW